MPPPGLSGCMAETLFSGCPLIRSSVHLLPNLGRRYLVNK